MKHCMRLNPDPFRAIKSGQKIYELRLFDEKRRLIAPGDVIEFTNTETGEILSRTVRALHLFDTFEALYAALPLERCGYTREEAASASASDMDEYYTPQQQAKFGTVAIELEPIL